MSDIIQISPAEYGLEESKAQQISDMFKPMLDKMVELEAEYNGVIAADISKDTCLLARTLRMKYLKIRTGTANIHKELKKFYLQGGRFVDGWKNAQLMASQGIEQKLSDIENHYANIEKEKIAKLQETRRVELLKYIEEVFVPDGLGIIQNDVWNNYLAGAKAKYEAQIEAERRAEQDRIAKEKAEVAERERIRQENEKLKKEAAEKERLSKIEAEERAKIEAERVAKESWEREEREAALKVEREAREVAERKERAAQAKLEAERKAIKETEEKRLLQEEAQRQAELSRGDADKMKDLLNELEAIKRNYKFKSKKNQELYEAVKSMIDDIIIKIN